LAALDLGSGRGYIFTDTGEGYILRFYQLCEFSISPDLRSVYAYPFPGVDPHWAVLLFSGNVLAFILTLARQPVLHASAVEIRGTALAFMGDSGTGKSTLAALFCAGGARFITDDVLRLESNGQGFYCFAGTTEIRLRQSAAVLAENFPAAKRGTTVDGRIAVRLDHPASPIPLGAIVIPRPSRRCAVPQLERLSPSKALLYLMAHSGGHSLQQREYLQQRFYFFARVASSIPVFQAKIPWGPPFASEIVVSLLNALGIA